MTIRKVHFVEFNAKLNTLAIRTCFPKYGTTLLATLLRDQGLETRVFLEGVSDLAFAAIADCDLVCLPLFAPAYNKVKAFATALRRGRPGVPIVIGGPHATLYPETVVGLCDYAVRGEGDEALPELVRWLSGAWRGRGGATAAPLHIKGLSFLDPAPSPDGTAPGPRLVHTPDRPPPAVPATIPDYRLIAGFDRLARGLGRFRDVQNTLQTSRGCKSDCAFCPTGRLFGHSYRTRDIPSVLADIRDKQRYNDWIFVVDNSFDGDRARTVELLEAIVRADLGATLTVFARQEVGRDDALLDLMKRAGVACLIVGVESLEDANLRAFRKGQTRDATIASLLNIKRHGIHVIATFAFGYDGDTADGIAAIRDLMVAHDLSLNLFILHDVGTKKAGDADLLIPPERRFATHYRRTDPADTAFYDYATGSFATYFPKRTKPSTLQRAILEAYDTLYTRTFLLKQIFKWPVYEALFGVTHGFGIRRMNRRIAEVVDGYYMDYLKTIEAGLYDENEVLDESKLDALGGLPLPAPIPDRTDLESNALPMLAAYAWPFARYQAGKWFRRAGRFFGPPRG